MSTMSGGVPPPQSMFGALRSLEKTARRASRPRAWTSPPALDAFTLRAPAATTTFPDRRSAGERLAVNLLEYAGRADVAIVGLAQGGAVVAAEVALQLQVPLATWAVKKLKAPCSGTIGALAQDGEMLVDEGLFRALRVTAGHLIDEVRRCRAQVQRRARLYETASLFSDLAGRVVIVVDEGICTGATLRAALPGIQRQGPERIIVAVPIASDNAVQEFSKVADEVVALETVSVISDLGTSYLHFAEVKEDDIARMLQKHRGISTLTH